MTITEFLKKYKFIPYGTVRNSWDSFNQNGVSLMQLWRSPGQTIQDNNIKPEAYLRVLIWDVGHFQTNGKSHVVGYNARRRTIGILESGGRGFAVMSSPPDNLRGPGVWAKYANFENVYPVIGIERANTGDIFAILGKPILANEMLKL